MQYSLLVVAASISLLTACNNQGGTAPTSSDSGGAASPQAEKPAEDKGASTHTPSAAFLIVAGEQVGHVHIMDSAAKPIRLLGQPDGGDAAMGSAMMTWMGKGTPPTQLDVYTHYRDTTMTDKAVKQIRTTSPDFATPDGLRAGLLLADAMKLQPGLKPLPDASGRVGTKLYDDATNGLAVETTGTGKDEKLASVIVHEKGREVRPVYR